MKASEFVFEKWSQKYKSSINCSHPKGFSQKAHCAGKNKQNESVEMEMVCETCGMCETHGNSMMEIKQRLDAKCWKGKHKEGTKIKGGIRVNNCVPNESIEESKERCQQCGMVGCTCTPGTCKCKPVAGWVPNKGFRKAMDEARDVCTVCGQTPCNCTHLTEEFDLIESIIEGIAEQNGVDAELVWADLESLTEDELYAFAVTSQLNEDWQKANKRDKTDGMSQKAVNAYRREHPGSKLKTAVTTKPSKLKRGSKASKRRKSYCSRSRGQMKMHNISCAKTPDKAICKARRRWNC
jgi:hypothetical protein